MKTFNRFVAGVAAASSLVAAVPAAYAAQATVKPISALSGTLQVGVPVSVRWQTDNFPSGGKVDITLIRQVSQSPRSFALVRKIAQGAPNTGVTTWIPASADIGSNMYMQIGCSTLSTFPQGCVSEDTPARLAVVGGNSVAQAPMTFQAMASVLASLQVQVNALFKLLGFSW